MKCRFQFKPHFEFCVLIFPLSLSALSENRYFGNNIPKAQILFNSQAVGVRNRTSKLIFFGVKDFFSCIMISKMGGPKIDFIADGTHESHQKAWELSKGASCEIKVERSMLK